MADPLVINNIKISPPRQAHPHLVTGEPPEFIDIEITLTNNSKKDLHVISSLRKIEYDKSTKTLSIDLSEPELPPGLEHIHKFPPRMTIVPKGSTETVKVSVPVIIKRIISIGDSGMSTEIIDISGLKHVKCTIASSSTKFRTEPSVPTKRMVVNLRKWGKLNVRTFNNKIPPRPDAKPETPAPDESGEKPDQNKLE